MNVRADIQTLYKPCPSCGGHIDPAGVQAAATDKLTQKLNKESNRIAKLIYDGNFKGKIDPTLTRLVANHLADAVLDGFGSNFSELDFGSKDYLMLANLEKNVYQFSAAKNYHQLKEINAALKDQDGKLRSFSDFQKQVKSISKVYNHAWLATEYNTANNGAILAARWNDYQGNADVMPLLQYETVGDARVREDHAELDGVTKKIDDSFWDTWYPPNGFNCRCTVNQLTDGNETPDKSISYPKANPMFKTNLAKQQMVFPKDHPYYNMPKGDKKTVKKEANKLTPHRAKDNG